MKKLFLFVILIFIYFSKHTNAEIINLDCKLLNKVEKGFKKEEEVSNYIKIDTSLKYLDMNGFPWDNLEIKEDKFVATTTNQRGDFATFTINRYTGEAVSSRDHAEGSTTSNLIKQGIKGPWDFDSIYQCEKAEKKF